MKRPRTRAWLVRLLARLEARGWRVERLPFMHGNVPNHRADR